MPSLVGREGKRLATCSLKHLNAIADYIMADHKLESDEDEPLWEAVKAAGQYLDELQRFDLRHLTRDQLMMFGSIVISKYAEARADWFENRRHPDDTFAKDVGIE